VVGMGDVLLRVHAASAFIGDWHVMTGLPYLGRLAFGLRTPKLRVRGQDVAGRVEAVGEEVAQFQVGDEVFGTCDGSFAEYANTRTDRVAPKPANLTFEQAATVPSTGTTALQALRDKGKVQSGQKVLIVGAAGGVGSFAVQIAKAFGANVTGVCSTSKVDLVRSIGADAVIDYTREDFADGTQSYDVILDIAGARSVSHLRRALGPKGTLVIVGGEGGGRWFGGIDRQLRATMLSPFVGQRLGTFIAKPNAEDLVVLKEFIEDGKVTPVIDRAYPLSEVPEAIKYLEEGHGRGKVVITV
jgi:NADPH:quinone reductase-like Zn-dependent oxidoreductase